MKLIQSGDELCALRTRWLRTGVSTNFFLTGIQLDSAISDARLYAEEYEHTAILLLRESLCDRLYLYLDDWEPPAWRPERPTTLEMPVRSDIEEQRIARYMEQLGFRPALQRLRMRRLPSAEWTKEGAGLLEVMPCAEHEAAEFLRRHFDAWFGCVPDHLDQVLGYRIDGELQAVLHYQLLGRTAEIRHLAVCAQMRGKGVASTLIAAMLQRLGQPLVRVWVNTDNVIAQRMYAHNGFAPDGRRSLAYLYR